MAVADEDFEDALVAVLGGDVTVLALDDAVRPFRLYAAFQDRTPSPALYVELEVDGEVVPVVVHNFGDYAQALDRWNLDPVDLLVLNELHELTHWAMTDDERARWDARSRMTGRPDGHWLNTALLDVLEHVDGRRRERPERTSLLRRAARWLVGR
jgi:hypothetical protein